MTKTRAALLFGVAIALYSGTFSNANRIQSPIENLEPSLAASAAHSTVVAVSVPECVVLLTRSPKAKATTLRASEKQTNSFKKFGMKLYHITNPPQTMLFRNNYCCIMTGFAADIAHLQLVMEGASESYRAVYCKDQPFRKTVLGLARNLQRATLNPGGRPFGIQALLLDHESAAFRVCTCDPTGSMRHCSRGATAIGRHSLLAKRALLGSLAAARDARSGVRVALQAIRNATAEAREINESTLDGIVVWKTERGLEMARIDSELLLSLFQESNSTLTA